MKKNYIFKIVFLIIISFNISYGQTAGWEWAKTATSSGGSGLGNIVVDDDENIYVSGSYVANITIGDFTFTDEWENAAVLLARYDSSGNVIWAKSIPYSYDGAVGIMSLAVDSSGNLYATGYYTTSFTLDSITFATPPHRKMFLAKFDADGNVIWAKNAEGIIMPWDMVTDDDDNLYICGSFSGNDTSFDSIALTNNGSVDMFTVKYDSNGNALWAAGCGGTGSDGAISIAVNSGGEIYIGGNFSSTTLTFGTTTLANGGENDGFLAKYDSLGQPAWAKSFGSEKSQAVQDIALDNQGNIITVGTYTNSVIFDTIVLEAFSEFNEYDNYMFVVKHDENGGVLWAKRAGSINEGNNLSNGVVTDAIGNIYWAATTFAGSINIGGNSYSGALFIGKLGPDGNVIEVIMVQANQDIADSTSYGDIALSTTGNLYLPGAVSWWATFGETQIGGDPSLFLAKYNGGALGMHGPVYKSVSLYPNPALSTLNITGDIDNTAYFITDMAGRTVTTGTIKNKTIDVAALSEGLYILNLDGGFTTKFIKN